MDSGELARHIVVPHGTKRPPAQTIADLLDVFSAADVRFVAAEAAREGQVALADLPFRGP